MAYAYSAPDFALPRVSARPRRGFFQRLLAAMIAARQRQAEREIALYLANCGGRLTDEVEREIERRFLSAPSRW